MAMYDVIVECHVYKETSMGKEKFETKVDDATLTKASGSSSRRELDPWAKTFFPTAKKVEVLSIRKK
jgi:hypothetical protein